MNVVATNLGDGKGRAEEFPTYYLGDTLEEAEENYTNFSAFIKLISNSYAYNTGVDAAEMFSAAVDGLGRAVRDWDPDRSKGKFRTYATFRIRTSLNDCIRRNKSMVVIPEYIRVAHLYITNIKTILEMYDEPLENTNYTLNHVSTSHLSKIHRVDIRRIKLELDKLVKLAKNSKVPYSNLIERSEYVPIDSYLNDDMTQAELYEAERRRMAAALMVSKLQDKMTEEELHVANGIIAGKSYGEIGRTYTPKRSIAWVQSKLSDMKEKFNGGTVKR